MTSLHRRTRLFSRVLLCCGHGTPSNINQYGSSDVFVLQGDGEGRREIGLEDVLRLVENLKQLSAADTDDTDTVEAFVALGGKVSSTDKP